MTPSEPSEPPKLPEQLAAELGELYLSVDEHCAETVERLINEHPDYAEAIRRRVARADAVFRDLASEPAALPKQIGRYEILNLLGEGGMGSVYLAEQHEPVHRLVALKVIKLGMDTKQVLTRFDAERQALALMNHDHIAKVLDAGTTERGQPYFVMEHVPGIPFTAYCDEQRLTTPERLRLFQQVCEAVQHAHQKGVIHRDLKPSNILIAQDQGRAVPKIIDFGIAKAINQRLVEATLFTELGQMVGTPEYMSPEAASSASDVDTRTDVYSLGVILYELLTGELPLRSEQLRGTDLNEILRAIRNAEPPKPSTRQSALGALSSATATNRRTTPSALRRALQGDLDWIVMKAIDKERSRRYATPMALAEDLERHLAHEPVLAGPPSTGYRLRKFVRRNRGSVVAAAAALVVLAGAAAGLSILAGEVRAGELASAHAEFDSARLDAAFGRWDAALAAYARARELGYGDPVGLTIREIEALEGSLELDKAMAKIRELRRRHDLGRHRAKVLLLEADLGVDRIANPRHKLELAERAVALGSLQPADEAFARALLAKDVLEALDHLERARRLAPDHRRANGMYAIALLACGRLDDAVSHARFLRAHYPDDVATMVYQAFVTALDGDDEGASELVERVRATAGEEAADTAELAIGVVPLIRWFNAIEMESLVDLDASPLGTGARNLIVVAVKLLPMLRWAKERERSTEPGSSSMFLAMAPSIVETYRPLLQVFPPTLSKLEAALQGLEDRSEALDGAVHFAHGLLLALAEAFDEAGDAFRRATDTPSIIVHPKTAAFYRLYARVMARRETEPNGDAAKHAEARCIECLGRAVSLVDSDPRELRFLHLIARELRRGEQTAEIALRWWRVAPEDPRARRAANAAIDELVRNRPTVPAIPKKTPAPGEQGK